MNSDGQERGDDPGAGAAELLRRLDAADRLEIVDRDLKRNGVHLAGVWAVATVSVGVGLLVNTLGFLGLLMVPQALFPLLRRRRRLNDRRREFLRASTA